MSRTAINFTHLYTNIHKQGYKKKKERKKKKKKHTHIHIRPDGHFVL